ncbi:hypothetical protein ACFQ3Z_35210 [Streptomyces nogalater]
MEQTALRPKPMPGQNRREEGGQGPVRRPHAAPRRDRRPRALLLGLGAGTVVLLCGIGLGIVAAVTTGVGGPAGPSRQTAPPVPAAHATAPAAPAPPGATLGVEVADGEKAGAVVVAVHVPGPGYTAWSAVTSCSSSARPASTPPPTSPAPSPGPAPARRCSSPCATAAGRTSS